MEYQEYLRQSGRMWRIFTDSDINPAPAASLDKAGTYPLFRRRGRNALRADIGNGESAVLLNHTCVVYSITNGVCVLKNYSHTNKDIPWDDLDHLLGTVSDQELARYIGCSHQNVSQRRMRLGTPSYGEVLKRIRPELNKAALCALTGEQYYAPAWLTMLEEVVLRAALEDPKEITLRKGIHLLGTAPDSHIALRLGLDATWLSRRRLAIGIPKFSIEAIVEQKAGHLLGQQTDQEIADWLGVSQNVVNKVRRRLGITSRYPNKAKSVQRRHA